MALEASSGTLTFLFADLEASTRLWEQFPQAMPRAIARHDELMRTSVEEADGRVVKTTGDGLMAVFGSAADALRAALAAQQRLIAEPWSSTPPLRARIGIHAGEAHGRDGDYFGAPVYRAARIMSAGHGGQVLLSELAADLARDEPLPTGVELRDLGEHRLKDLLEPEHIFELSHPDLPTEFPPLMSLGRRPHNLPIQYSELIGREDELRELRELLDAPGIRLLTLSGPGGIGKTRLALQAAAEQLDRFADGVVFVDLSEARDEQAALAAIARAAGVGGLSDMPLLDLLKRELSECEQLLLLDNFEQVMSAADDVAALLAHGRRLKVLMTSREALRVRGERLFPVQPLTLPERGSGPVSAAAIGGNEAVRLFVDRAQAARPDFVLTDANAPAVLEICTRLDGLPLALELAAARLKLFSAPDLADRLRRRLDVLRGGPRDLPARQQTLRDTIEWSYELLLDDERLLFCLLSVFSGARIEAVEQVAARVEAARHVDVLDALSSLIDKSLVRSLVVDDDQRLSMLETIREYAGERLAAEPDFAAAVRRAHAEYFSQLAAAVPERGRAAEPGHPAAAGKAGSASSAARDALAVELGNLQTAWRHWLEAGQLAPLQPLLDALWVLHETRGWYGAAVALASELLDLLGRQPPSEERLDEELALRMSVARGLLALRGYTDEVEEIYREALRRSEAAGRLPRRLSVLRSLANFHLYRGEIGKTREMGEQLLELGVESNDERLQVEGHFLVGVTTAFMGDVATGQHHLETAGGMFDVARHGATRLRFGPSPGVTIHTSSALLHWFTGRLDKADEQASLALRLASKIGHPYSEAYGCFHVGLLHAYSLRFERARELGEKTLAIATEHDYAVWRAVALVLLGTVTAHLGRPVEGLARAEEGLELVRRLTMPPIFWPTILALQAETLGLAGRADESLALLAESIRLADPQDLQTPFLFVQQADVLGRLGRLDDAEESFRTAVTRAGELGTLTARLIGAMGLVALRSPATEEDRALLRATLGELREGTDSVLLGAARTILEAT